MGREKALEEAFSVIVKSSHTFGWNLRFKLYSILSNLPSPDTVAVYCLQQQRAAAATRGPIVSTTASDWLRRSGPGPRQPISAQPRQLKIQKQPQMIAHDNTISGPGHPSPRHWSYGLAVICHHNLIIDSNILLHLCPYYPLLAAGLGVIIT